MYRYFTRFPFRIMVVAFNNPFRPAVPLRGQTTLIPSIFSPKRNWSTKMVKLIPMGVAKGERTRRAFVPSRSTRKPLESWKEQRSTHTSSHRPCNTDQLKRGYTYCSSISHMHMYPAPRVPPRVHICPCPIVLYS